MAQDYTKEALPPVADHEIEFIVTDALGFAAAQSTRSQSKTVGNFRFRILVFPSGTHTTNGQQVSAFVEADAVEGLDPRWVFQGVKYQITIINWLNYRHSITKADTWTFSKDGIDRGWHDMLKTSELTTETGWLGPDNSICLRASCYVRQADSINISSDYNIRRETGHIGLMNHGATCYMNGLLQSLFHVGEFRRIVYSIECEEQTDTPGKDDVSDPSQGTEAEGRAPPLIQALQNVFYRLQTSDQAVNCRELMKSFGWDTMDAFTQHDAQELNRLLCDRLEEQMKGTPMDGSIKRLFEGEMENYIECMDVDYKSQRNETFHDLQLNIKGERGQELRHVEESLRDFTTEETLEKDNAYEAEGHGKQRARKGIRFLTFPPVLNLQLKRFHFDLEKMEMVKLNSRFEFPRRLDLSPFASGAGAYLLHAVVVHSGDVNSGHYYAHIRPTLENSWYKFDDDTVTPCSEYAAIEGNFGGNDLAIWNYFDRNQWDLSHTLQTPTRPRIHNAYMLVYIREDCAPEVLKAPDPRITNPRMVDRYSREVRVAEQRRRDKIEQQLKIRVKLVFDRDLRKMTGFWDHVEIKSDRTLKMGRDQPVKELAAEVESMTGVAWEHLAFFSLHYRNNPRQVRFAFMPPNNQFRSHIPQLNAPHFDTSDPYLMVLCVASKGYDFQTLKWSPTRDGAKPDNLCRWADEQAILLIVKYFCQQNKKIVTLGCYYVPCDESLIMMVNEGWVAERLAPYINNKDVVALPEEPEGVSWSCWEEFNERDIQPRSTRRMVKTEQLWSGDVIIWQSAPAKQSDVADDAGTGGNISGTDPATARPAPGVEDDVAPVYPVNTVADLAAYLSNSVDVTVVLHDTRQPLCVDGVVANGAWGPQRPQSAEKTDATKKEPSPQKEERPEDVALSLSPAQFVPAKEKELKMDLRWHVPHVTGTIARAFGLRTPATGLWLFNAAPSATCEEPLNAHGVRSETTLVGLQSSPACAATLGKKPLVVHAVELPAVPQADQRTLRQVCVRFFDDAVREVGSAILPVSETGTVGDILAEAKNHLQPEWGISAPLRALEVSDCRLHRVYKPEVSVRALLGYARQNIFFHSLRVEADTDVDMAEGTKVIELYHCDRASQQAFAQPVLLPLEAGEKSGSIKNRIKAKLKVPDAEFKSWRLVRLGKAGRVHLKDEEAWDSDTSPEVKLCLEHVHPNPSHCLARHSRHNKPLTIK
eukprot:TRINITY_DN4266_c0_g1_i1.p1 TRINITY_DN4266_c0_g1~~TRINITY_DN4266_c0_g1_i1.p1  ORF type:complete len:1211 (-),score=249.41 TRINITY_DN4266_c0_g1_i1:146-3778(-)